MSKFESVFDMVAKEYRCPVCETPVQRAGELYFRDDRLIGCAQCIFTMTPYEAVATEATKIVEGGLHEEISRRE